MEPLTEGTELWTLRQCVQEHGMYILSSPHCFMKLDRAYKIGEGMYLVHINLNHHIRLEGLIISVEGMHTLFLSARSTTAIFSDRLESELKQYTVDHPWLLGV